ncbi:hypothetical protein ACHWQZ_G013186 [Mnemiopsis leidyi]
MGDIKFQKFLSKKGWRGFSSEKVLKIREQYPDIDPYLHTEIVLDWISAKKPRQEIVSDFWDCSVQLHLNTTYQDLIRRHLSSRRYEVSYVCRTKEKSELQTCQSFTLDQCQISDLLDEQTVELSNTCKFEPCCKGNTDHVINVKLDRTSPCSLLVNATTPTSGHTHVGYKHWFLIRPDTAELVSLSLSSVEGLVAVIKKCRQCVLYVLMLNCDSVIGK